MRRVAEVGADPAGPDFGQPAPAGRLPVEEDGDAELLPDPFAKAPGRRHPVGHGGAAQRHQRHHVGHTHPGMDARVPAQVDPLDRQRHTVEQLVHQPVESRVDQRHHAAAVVGVGVGVEHAGPSPELFDEPTVRAHREVGYRLPDHRSSATRR